MGRVDGSEIFKRHPPVLQLFFSSACRILLDLWTFSPVGARERSLRICICARACERTPDYQYQKPDHYQGLHTQRRARAYSE
eukprot:COSAG05_NODE_67_length_22197_cov_42.906417_5_plen_82_part_00